MKLAIYGRPIKTKDFKVYFDSVMRCFERNDIAFEAVASYQSFLKEEYNIDCPICDPASLNPDNYACLISFGGDGTILDTLALVKDSGLPVMGINLGRLGFLANIKMDEFEIAIKALKSNDFDIDSRAVLEVQSDHEALQDFPYALNDFVVQKRDTSAMITVKADLNGDFLNNYWADGLIVATPTGSSGYSMSCGGPLVFPGSQAFVITPIAAHNLTVRPAVVPDENTLNLQISGRGKHVLISLDSRSFRVPNNTKISIQRGRFEFKMIKLKDTTYMDTIRNKLLWGADRRDNS